MGCSLTTVRTRDLTHLRENPAGPGLAKMSTQSDGLNVIALVSGGKDSFFSLLHCRANGHRIVALANLHPALPRKLGSSDDTSRPPAVTISAGLAANAAVSAPVLGLAPGGGLPPGPDQDVPPSAILPDHEGGVSGNESFPNADEDERDLNSFMYQTVGHEVIPLYAEATGIPLYRRAITGGATQQGKEYSHYRHAAASGPGEDAGTLGPDHGQKPEAARTGHCDAASGDSDETESMVPLLQAIKKAHPEANAICAGAILSTYQRTRVESVATRLGLTPLAYLWKFPVLPTPGPSDPVAGSDAQLLDDMAAARMEARVIKAASGGLDDSFLWTNVAAATGKSKLARAMRRFGAAETGAVIGEGGEFETLVLDGPPSLFKKRIIVAEEDRRVVREGGGSVWLSLRNARLKGKDGVGMEGSEGSVRVPDLLDPKFVTVLDTLSSQVHDVPSEPQSRFETEIKTAPQRVTLQTSETHGLQQWSFVSDKSASVDAETRSIVECIRRRLQQHSLTSSAILNATVVLRRMADFPAVNSIYGTLFDAPNPPSRVTISCGDALSAAADDANIAVYLTVHTALQPGQRQGLHVQSRSYWAPANIGPYSQAISFPVASLGSGNDDAGVSSAGSPRLVSIAGQIPLVPATMALPPSHGSEGMLLRLQLALSLQHLWRIGVEMGVQWWTSAVAYFPAFSSETGEKAQMGMAVKARLAAQAWSAAHRSTAAEDDEDDDGENGPDLWDRRYNPQYMTFSSGSGEEKKAARALPDRSVLLSTTEGPVSTSKVAIPPLFVAEVEELPRGAGVEWHAHLGVAAASEGSVGLREMCLPVPPSPGHSPSSPGDETARREVAVSQVIVEFGEGKEPRFVQTVIAEGFEGGALHGHDEAAKAAVAQLGEVGSAGAPAAAVKYVDAGVLKASGGRVQGVGQGFGPVVPCRSLWDSRGQRLVALTVYQSVLE